MVQSNEFTAASLAGVIRSATTTYRREEKREAGSLLDEVEDLRRQAQALEQSARRSGVNVAINTAIAAAGALGTAARALRLIRRMRFKDLDRSDIIGLIPVIGGVAGVVIEATRAIKHLQEARRLERKAGALEARANRFGDNILRIVAEYRRAGCGQPRATS